MPGRVGRDVGTKRAIPLKDPTPTADQSLEDHEREMPRQPRLDIEGALHHVMIRGLDGQTVFLGDGDREDFTTRLAGLVPETGVRVFAWVIMSNHAHFLVRTGPEPLSRVMRRLLTGYAVGFNRRHSRRGHLFQNRYKSVLVEEETYFLELVRYIHLNPLRAGMLTDLDQLDTFAWAGHSALLGGVERPWQDADTVLGRFAGSVGKARKGYREFMAAGIGQGHRDELSGGGLVRSAGGNREVLEKGRGREPWSFDERILGSSEFVEQVWAETERQGLENQRAQGGDLEDLIDRVAAQFGLTPAELRGGNRRRGVVAARRCVAWLAVRQWGGSPTAVARALGVSRSTVLRGLEEKPEGVDGVLGREQC